MLYLGLKTLHVLGAILLFGTGLGSAFYKYMVWRSGSAAAIAVTDRLVVRADWWFTTPAVILQPLTGFAMVWLAGWPLDSAWLLWTGALYLLAGACWLPVVWLQLRMRETSARAIREGVDLPPAYARRMRLWFWLGVPAFSAMLVVVALMVFRPV
ncbi:MULTISPECIES: DUF2269 family protein [Thioalkalivibrio]|uniref:DUF2269 domain-containing protein n=1 Tax=Thioalkalivibrio halophilus TaxID=252474 RepID=A0A1V2ZUX2_9GAMM|nr:MULTISPECIES: DUF2269 domain-containing protein [Thioalkalivibrio]OOC08918.1 hypothetical protein B1A74_13735 [Thioalkalivibrio halophilus]PYG00372.1 putative membrane protein [Thioalkalivibrio sp. ALE21]